MNPENSTADQAVYPKPTSDGFFFDDETNESFGIESKEYENGNRIRKCTLSTGAIAIVRELTGKEVGKDVQRLIKGDKEKYEFAMIALSAKLDDKAITMEDVEEMRAKDFTRLRIACQDINF